MPGGVALLLEAELRGCKVSSLLADIARLALGEAALPSLALPYPELIAGLLLDLAA